MPCHARWQLRLVNHACGSAANTELAWVPPPADAAGAEAEACPCGLGHYAARARRQISAGEELSYSCACRATEPASRAATSGAAPLTPLTPPRAWHPRADIGDELASASERAERQALLLRRWGFHCRCELCVAQAGEDGSGGKSEADAEGSQEPQ